MAQTSSNFTIFLDGPPCCVEFYPLDPSLVLVGTYELQSEERSHDDDSGRVKDEGQILKTKHQERSGAIVLLKQNSAKQLSVQTTVPTASAVLDLHFHPQDPRLCLVAMSTGTMSAYRLVEYPVLSMQRLWTASLFSSETLITSFVFSALSPDCMLILASLSTGSIVALAQKHPDQVPTLIDSSVNCHEGRLGPTTFPVQSWCVTFLGPSQCVLSGGDDRQLRLSQYDKNSLLSYQEGVGDGGSPEDGGLGIVTSTIHKGEAGVTAILSLPTPEQSHLGTLGGSMSHVLLVGSFSATDGDKNLVILYSDEPNGANGLNFTIAAEEAIEGGVWRLKLLPDIVQPVMIEDGSKTKWTWIVMACCMHAGAKVLSISMETEAMSQSEHVEARWSLKTLFKFKEHESMCYGGDVRSYNSNKQFDCVTLSFYDRRVSSWSFNLSDDTNLKRKP